MTMVQDTASAGFEVSYEGDAVADHTMDVRDLAPALLALGDMFNRANGILNGERASISLHIRATKPGSFELALLLLQLYHGTTGILAGDFITSAANLKQLLIGAPGVMSVVGLFKRLKGRTPKEIGQNKDAVTLEIDNLRLSVPVDVYRLCQDRDIKNSAQRMVEPLQREGVDRMLFRERGRQLDVIEKIEKDDADSFTPTTNVATNEILVPRQVLRIVAPNFSEGQKWRLSDGANTHWYAIRDEKFVREMHGGMRRFGSGDQLVCRVRIVQRLTPKLENDYEILNVLEHCLQDCSKSA